MSNEEKDPLIALFDAREEALRSLREKRDQTIEQAKQQHDAEVAPMIEKYAARMKAINQAYDQALDIAKSDEEREAANQKFLKEYEDAHNELILTTGPVGGRYKLAEMKAWADYNNDYKAYHAQKNSQA